MTRTTFNEILTAADRNDVGPTKDSMDVLGYEALAMVLQMAYEQAAGGKGAERHASNGLSARPFHAQPMQTESDELGSLDGLLFQARKKAREGATLPTTERQIKEWLGAINYLAGCVIWKLRHEPADESPTVVTDPDGKVRFDSDVLGVKGQSVFTRPKHLADVEVTVQKGASNEHISEMVNRTIMSEHLRRKDFETPVDAKVREEDSSK